MFHFFYKKQKQHCHINDYLTLFSVQFYKKKNRVQLLHLFQSKEKKTKIISSITGILFATRHLTLHMKLEILLTCLLLKCVKMMETFWGIWPWKFCESWNSHWTEVLHWPHIYINFCHSFYLEPPDGEDIVDFFQK